MGSTQNHIIGIPILKYFLNLESHLYLHPILAALTRFGPNLLKFDQPGTASVWNCTYLVLYVQFWPFWPDLDQIWLKFDPIWNCTCLLELHLHTWILKNNRLLRTGNSSLWCSTDYFCGFSPQPAFWAQLESFLGLRPFMIWENLLMLSFLR